MPHYDDDEYHGSGRVKVDRGESGGTVQLDLTGGISGLLKSRDGLMRVQLFGRTMPIAVDITHEIGNDGFVSEATVNQRTEAEVTWSTGKGGGTFFCDVPAMFVIPGAEYVDVKVALKAYRLGIAAARSSAIICRGSIAEVSSPTGGSSVITLTKAITLATTEVASTVLASDPSGLLLEPLTKGVRIYAAAAPGAESLEARYRVNASGVGIGTATLLEWQVVPGEYVPRPGGAQAIDITNNSAGSVTAVIVQELAI